MASMYGNKLKISIFGQSHSPAIGVTIDGLPAGLPVDMDALNRFLVRRAPGQNALSTPRREADAPEFLCGLYEGVTCGAPLTAIIHNTNTRSKDYANLADCPRPGHADYPASVKWNGYQDPTGGGHFSGRLTAPLCIAGGIALQFLSQRGICVGAHVAQIEHVHDTPFDGVNINADLLQEIREKAFPVVDDGIAPSMEAAILAAKGEADSVGGIVECAVLGVPAGVGDPMFDGLESRLAAMLFAVPAVKGVEFGAGFGCATMRGSACNDPYVVQDGTIRTTSNNNGGILGGIANGMPILVRTVFKPTSSIGIEQDSVSLSRMEPQKLTVHGRHDPCIVLRAVPVVEAAVALALLDAIL
ncbi:MAG: chorismate synthase [Clostridiales bacterium]|nr:chorismate synthase [Clostridiales bacterium]